MDHDPFEVRANVEGAYLEVGGIVLTTRCMSDGEVDMNVQRLKDRLEEAAKSMKRAWREQRQKPDL